MLVRVFFFDDAGRILQFEKRDSRQLSLILTSYIFIWIYGSQDCLTEMASIWTKLSSLLQSWENRPFLVSNAITRYKCFHFYCSLYPKQQWDAKHCISMHHKTSIHFLSSSTTITQKTSHVAVIFLCLVFLGGDIWGRMRENTCHKFWIGQDCQRRKNRKNSPGWESNTTSFSFEAQIPPKMT